MDKQSISLGREEKYYSKGKWYVLFDHLLLFYIYFRIILIHSAFYNTIQGARPIDKRIKLEYFYVIPIPLFLLLVLYFIVCLQRTSSFKEKITDWRTTRVRSFMTSTLPIAIAFLFSLLFFDSLKPLIVDFPEQYQDSVIPAYYMSYIYALMYSVVRVLCAFDYYKSFYFKLNRDFMLRLTTAYIIIFTILTIFFPRDWLYIFF